MPRCVRARATGLVEEAFLDAQGGFAANVELAAEQDNPIEWTFCDPSRTGPLPHRRPCGTPRPAGGSAAACWRRS
ncbi:MAG: hypothetical protein U0736_25875 [Gemmataceae bacterium]